MSTTSRDDTIERILGHFGSLMRQVSGWHAPDFLGLDITMSQAKCLYVVALHPGTSISSIAEKLQVGLSAVSGLVDRLVDHGYLDRREDPRDRRQHQLRLTPEGEAVIARIRELNAAHLRALLAGLSAAELRSLATGVAALEREARAIDGVSLDAPTDHERTAR